MMMMIIVSVDNNDDDNARLVPGVVALDGLDTLYSELWGRKPAQGQKVI